MFFKIKCYIIDIKNNDLIISITDSEELAKFHKNLIKLYKNQEDFNKNQDIFKIKYNNQTKFEIKFNYNNIKDLKGCSVIISGTSKYYCFSYNNEIIDENTNLFKIEKKIKRGFTLLANKIIN